MRSVGEHLNLCLLAAEPLPELAVPLEDAVGCVLSADIIAESSLPATDLAGGDGYAVRAQDVAHAPTILPVTADIQAGDTVWTRLVPGSAIRIASGAPLPPGADAVVPVESTDMGISQVTINQPVSPGFATMVIPSDMDVPSGTTVLRAGQNVTRLGFSRGTS